MKVGAEPKRLIALGVLLLLAGYFIFTNLTSGPPQGSSAPAPSRTEVAPLPTGAVPTGSPVPRAEARTSSAAASTQEFRPSLRLRRPDQTTGLSSMDATLRLDLLTRLQEVQPHGRSRSLFEFSAAPPPPEPKVIPKPKLQTVPLPPPPPKAAEPPPKPTAPPIPLKFFGYTTTYRQGNRRAFFLDADQILVGGEGDVLKKRYRIVRIGVNSVVLEDLDFKAEQTLPLEPPVG